MEHFSVHAITERLVSHLAIPTTAGTGSEVRNVALVKDQSATSKFFVLDNAIFPRTAVLDPELTKGLPPQLSEAFCNAMTGLVYAIAHALGGGCGVHHGLANSIMLPHVIRFNAEGDSELWDGAIINNYRPVVASDEIVGLLERAW